MIRLRVPHWYTRMRTATKLQIVAAISVGFLIGYIFIPGSSDRSASKHKEGKDVSAVFPLKGGTRVFPPCLS